MLYHCFVSLRSCEIWLGRYISEYVLVVTVLFEIAKDTWHDIAVGVRFHFSPNGRYQGNNNKEHYTLFSLSSQR